MFSKLLSFPFLTTRFPESKSCAIGFSALVDTLEDHTVVFAAELKRIRTPLSLICNTPEIFLIGVSLLATHTTVRGDIFLYHTPKYLLVDEFPGLKCQMKWRSSCSKIIDIQYGFSGVK
ncbi:Copia protein [Senna tora]|uniref:Copia protein n=1 Tax=Senna tora TaxID=362788 RepID=A0A834TIE8_9FABA|nr:Copia protein [Senna tora]